MKTIDLDWNCMVCSGEDDVYLNFTKRTILLFMTKKNICIHEGVSVIASCSLYRGVVDLLSALFLCIFRTRSFVGLRFFVNLAM